MQITKNNLDQISMEELEGYLQYNKTILDIHQKTNAAHLELEKKLKNYIEQTHKMQTESETERREQRENLIKVLEEFKKQGIHPTLHMIYKACARKVNRSDRWIARTLENAEKKGLVKRFEKNNGEVGYRIP